MKIGVVGVGGHATANLYPNLRGAGLELVATCARHHERAESAAKAWGAQHAFASVETMLASVELDGVIVSVAPADYAPLVAACLEAGVPVFCEKPAAATAAEAMELAGLSEASGVPVVVGYMKRFAPAYQRAREIVQSDDFGPASLAAFTFAMGQWPNLDARHYLTDNSVHPLDLARYLVGELEDVRAHLTELPGFGHAVAMIARASSGAVCTFNFCTTASWFQRNEVVEVYGKGHAVCVDNVDTCTYRPAERPEMVWRPNYTVPISGNSSPTTMGFLPELEHFRQVALKEVESTSDMRSAAATLTLVEQLCDEIGV